MKAEPYTYNGYVLPENTRASIDRYAQERIPTGGFLEAVLANDLIEAVGRADEKNMAALPAIAIYVYNKIPGDCWGSREKVKAWLEGRE